MSSRSGSNPQLAVFLSYASQDADASRRVAGALRAADVEVWFDQDELRGGDEWDRKIKNQIRTCALFVPVISANTQARPEGYFRLEWHLAEQRSLLIAKGRAFIVPVCIDDTPEAEALVPDAFLAVQWMRPASDAKLAQFVAQVQRLLATGVAPASSRQSGSAGRMPALLQTPDRPSIPDYELVRRIGQGSYGDVWLARGVTGIWRAIKVVWRERFADAGPFEREFKGLKEFAEISLGESIQMALLHVGRNDLAGFFYYVMELADDAERGREIDPASYVPLTFAELRARRGRVPAAECVNFGAELARVLASLHRRGLVHRDIKPSNVILVGGVPKLADIGLVTLASDARTFVGTEGFVPPEGPGSSAADVYALGKVLYELVTGLDRQEFPQLPAGMERLPDRRALLELNEVVLRACDPRPERRYPDGEAMAADLEALHGGRSVRGRRVRNFALRAAAAVVALALLGAGAWKWLRHLAADSAPTQRPEAAATSEKSLVVLPFENLSPDPANAFFTDGMHAEVIATLSRLADLRVVSRATAQTFKAAPAPLPEVGRRLGVANVLSGSVRRDGTSVRVQLELRRASDEALLWQKTFDRKLEPGFALQDEIGEEVARILQARAGSGWYVGAQFMTKNPEAYTLFLQAREIPFVQGTSRVAFAEQIRLAKEALRLDPGFMSAASLLSSAYTYYWFTETDPAEAKETAANAKRWAQKASELMPGGAGDGALAVYYSMVERDHARALPFALNEVRALPNDANGHNRLASSLGAYGRYQDSAAELERALALDPLNVRVLHNRVMHLARLRRVADFEAAAARSLEFGGRNVDRGMMADLRFRLTGELPKASDNLSGYLPVHVLLPWLARRYEEVVTAADVTLARPQGVNLPIRLYALRLRGAALRWLGRDDALAAMAGEALAFAEQQKPADGGDRSDYDWWRMWSLTFAGRADEAQAAGRRWVEAASGPARVTERWEREFQLAQVYAWFGRKKECIELLEKLILWPSLVTVPHLKLAPDWDRVRDDPAFQAILADPKNSALL